MLINKGFLNQSVIDNVKNAYEYAIKGVSKYPQLDALLENLSSHYPDLFLCEGEILTDTLFTRETLYKIFSKQGDFALRVVILLDVSGWDGLSYDLPTAITSLNLSTIEDSL